MDSKSNNRLLTNMLSYAILQVVNMLVGLFLPRLYLAVYGSEINGIISTINGFTTYFAYLEAGLGITLIHSLFKPLADGDAGSTNSILLYSKKQYQKISYIYFALVVALSLIFPLARIANDIGKVEFALLVFVIGAYGALDFYSMAKYRVLLTADRKEYVISYAMILAQLMRFVFVWALLRFELSVVLVKIVPILTLFIRTVILKIYVRKKYPELSFSASVPQEISASKHRWDALLLQISISTSVALPTIIISQFLGYTEANVFAVYSLVINAMISGVSAMSSGVSPMLGRRLAQGKSIKELYNVYDHIVTLVLSIAFSVTAVMILPFVSLYTNVVSDANYLQPSYAILFAIWGALYSYRIPVTAVMNAAGIYRQGRVHNIINLAIQVVAGILAALWFGVDGLLVVMIISAIQRNVSLTSVNGKELLHNGIGKCLLRQLLMIVIVSGSFFAMSYVRDVAAASVGAWVVSAVAVSLICGCACVVLVLLSDIGATRKMLGFAKNKLLHRADSHTVSED